VTGTENSFAGRNDNNLSRCMAHYNSMLHRSLIMCHKKCMNFCGDYMEKYVTVQFSLDKCYSE